MRFEEIKEFKIDDLVLDKGNYRFSKAEDQQACVKKIYSANPPYFRGLMKSVAEDDLGEPLLVYDDGEDNIVADGNRRLSALKVLYDNRYSPNQSLIDYAEELRAKHKIDFSKIQAQYSKDKTLISKTVFERHSSGKNGTSRIPWNAYAAARFGFDEHIGDDREWYIMALLSKAEELDPELDELIDSGVFSYEVFRRLVRAAVKLGRISEIIFSARGEKIKKTAKQELVQDAVQKTREFLFAIRDKKISLSRKDGGVYADSTAVDKFVSRFPLSPDNQELEDAKNSSTEHAGGAGSGSPEADQSSSPDNSSEAYDGSPALGGSNDTDQTGNGSSAAGGSGASESSDSIEYGIGESEKIKAKLIELGIRKLNGLYYSLCKVSLNKHPALMYVGAWSFLEVLSRAAGNANQDFPSFFNGKFASFGFDKNTSKDCRLVLEEISKYGNSTKHSKNATPMTAVQLKNNFEVLEPLILVALDEAIKLNK